jgi:hypothetical protein
MWAVLVNLRGIVTGADLIPGTPPLLRKTIRPPPLVKMDSRPGDPLRL